MMRYKGMEAKYEYVTGVGCFCGEVTNCPDVISFSASSLTELHQAMQASVDMYLAYQKSVYHLLPLDEGHTLALEDEYVGRKQMDEIS